MISRLISLRRSEECQVHGAPSRTAHRTLMAMLLASLVLILWHVWVYGPTGQEAGQETLRRPFHLELGAEIWDLLFSRKGIAAELWDVFPYFIVGILMAGYIRTYKLAVKLQMALRRHGIASVFLASLVGIITPLCACGTLTTAVSLLFAGLPLAPVMSLMVTSPLLSPSTYLLTLNDLGPEWTVIRTVAAFSMGIIAGTVTHLVREKGFRTNEIIIEGAVPRGDFHDEDYPDERLRCNCRERFGHRVAARTDNMFVIFLAKSSEMLWLVGKYVLVGVTLGAVVERYMPNDWIYSLFGRKDGLSIVWITLGSVPVFLHQISASSILYHIKSTLGGTLDGGAALAFMIGGPVTAVPTMVMFWTIFRKRVFFLYMGVCILGTILISYAFQFFVFVPHADLGNPLLKNVGSLTGGRSAVIEKTDRNVRMVMDPGGKGLIATYANDLSGQGGVVFDGGVQRFLNGPAAGYDDRTYIGNIASWLEQNSSSLDGKRILVYDMSRSSGPEKGAIGGASLASLENEGFRLRVTGRREQPEITDGLLAGYGQLWIIFRGRGQEARLSDDELNAIARFNGGGRGMLVVAGGRDDDLAALNRLSGRYGVRFSGFTVNGDEVRASTASYFFNRASESIGRVLKVVRKA